MYVNAHTQTDNLDFGKNSEGGEGPKNFEENKNMGKKQDCLWNVSRIKNYIKDKNSSYTCNTSKSNSLNDIIKKYKPNQKKSETDKNDKKDKKEIPKPKNKSNSTNISTKQINNYKNNPTEKNTTININKNFINTKNQRKRQR